MTAELRQACIQAVHVITSDGEVLRAGRAAMFILRGLGFRRMGAIGGVPPFSWAVELGYWVVARNRKLFARFMFRQE